MSMPTKPTLSIITAIHNALEMNRVYWESLRRNTTSPFELIIVDNHSTDGSEKFFAELSERFKGTATEVVHLRNPFNQSYPVSQNQGMKVARADILCFLNNDIWLPPAWNEPFEAQFHLTPLAVLSPLGQEAQPRQSLSDSLKMKWKWISLLSEVWKQIFFRSEEARLWKALKWMYGDLEKFVSPTPPLYARSFDGINGNCVLFTRALATRFPEIWDPRVEAADWHLYLTLHKAQRAGANIPLPQILTSVYVHHYGRYSTRLITEPMVKPANSVPLSQLWSREDVENLWWGSHLPA